MTDTLDIIPQLDEQVDIALARLDFWEFCLWMDGEFFDKRPFAKKIAEAFMILSNEYDKGNAINVSVSMPPRASKSYITSLFSCWWLGKHPDKSVMRNSCTARLYEKFSYDCRSIIRSDKFKKVFPEIRMAEDKQSLNGWNLSTAKQVSYFGAGVGGSIIGFGCNLAISDDLYSGMEQALSEVYNEKVFMWKQSASDSRKEKGTPEIYIGTRWSKNDIIGKAIEDNLIDIQISVPALVDGKSFCEDVKTTEEYLKIKQDTEESIFEAEYQQNPIEIKGLLFPKSQLRFFKPEDFEGKTAEYKYMAVDPADLSDDTSAPTCKLYGNGIYVTEVIYNNNGTNETIPALVDMIVSNQLDHVEIEGVGGWKMFGSDVRKEVNEGYPDCEVRIIKNNTNKEVRIQQFSSFIKNHFYFLHEDYYTPDYAKFMKVLTSYLREGKSKKDDAPDSLTIAASFFKRTFPNLF